MGNARRSSVCTRFCPPGARKKADEDEVDEARLRRHEER
jgi:hypothetical protein